MVVERTFADPLGMHVGDTDGAGGRPPRVVGTAVTAARPVFPSAGWHAPGGAAVEKSGPVRIDRGDIAAVAGVLALAIAGAATLAPVIRAAAAGTTQALAGAPMAPHTSGCPGGRPAPGVANARRRRARPVTVNTVVTTAALDAVLTSLAQPDNRSGFSAPATLRRGAPNGSRRPCSSSPGWRASWACSTPS